MAIEVVSDYTIMERRIVRRLRDDASRRLVAEALNEIAVLAVFPCAAVERRARPNELLQESIASVTAVAIETLIDELEDLVEELEPSALQELAEQQRLADLGME
jgi:hypothetical protein